MILQHILCRIVTDIFIVALACHGGLPYQLRYVLSCNTKQRCKRDGYELAQLKKNVEKELMIQLFFYGFN